MKGRQAKSCLACGKAKQKCIGAIWECGKGASGEPSGAASADSRGMVEVLKELVAGQKVMVTEIKNVGKLLCKGLWGRDPEEDDKKYKEWIGDWNKEELEKEIAELTEESDRYKAYLGKIYKDKEVGMEGEEN